MPAPHQSAIAALPPGCNHLGEADNHYHQLLLSPLFQRTNTFKFSYSARIVSNWNSLSLNILISDIFCLPLYCHVVESWLV